MLGGGSINQILCGEDSLLLDSLFGELQLVLGSQV